MFKSIAFFSLVLFSLINPSFAQEELLLGKKVKTEDAKTVEEPQEKKTATLHLKDLTVAELSSPRATMALFLQSMDEVKKGKIDSHYHLFKAAQTFNSERIDPSERDRFSRIAAENLIQTIDRISIIQLGNIPDHKEGSPWIYRRQSIVVNNQPIDVEISIARDSDGAWRFTPETMATIESFYLFVKDRPVLAGVVEYKNWRTQFKALLPTWMNKQLFIFTYGQWIGAVSLFGVAFFGLLFTRGVITLYIKKLVQKNKIIINEKELSRSSLPFGLFCFALICLAGIQLMELSVDHYRILIRAFYIILSISGVWSLIGLVDLIGRYFFRSALSTENKFDDVLVPMLTKSAKVLIFLFGIVLVAHSLTFDVGSILAGLGLGGVAIALAAKDTISNLFGSICVIMDRPFMIGDYIVLDKGLEGNVEEVGFRSTRIRTPSQSVVSLPNSVLANMAIDNLGLRSSRRFRTFLKIDYSTPIELVEEFCERLRYMCKIHEHIDTDKTQIYIHELTDTSINVLFNVYISTKKSAMELQERHKIIVEIIKQAKEMGVNLYVPSNKMVLMQQQEERQTSLNNVDSAKANDDLI